MIWHQTTECVQAAYLPPSQETHSHIKAASWPLCTCLAHSTHSVDVCWVACWWFCSSVPVMCPLTMPLSLCLAWTSQTVNGSRHLQMSLWISQALATAAWRKSGFRKSLCAPAVTPTAALGDPNSGGPGWHGWQDPISITQTRLSPWAALTWPLLQHLCAGVFTSFQEASASLDNSLFL